MTQRAFPGMEEVMPITQAEQPMDYGAFMRSTTPHERVEAIVKVLKQKGLGGAPLSVSAVISILDWLVEAAGPSGYENVPLDWIRKLRQAKDGAK